MKGSAIAGGLAKDVILKIAIAVVVIVLIYLLLIRPIFIKVGLVDSKEDKQVEKEAKQLGTALSSPFSPGFYKDKSSAKTLTPDKAKELARLIYKALTPLTWILSPGFSGHQEEQVYGALRQLTHKTQLSNLSEVFFQEYKKDMYGYMRERMDNEEMAIVNTIASKLL